jgi:hypothetical protein
MIKVMKTSRRIVTSGMFSALCGYIKLPIVA